MLYFVCLKPAAKVDQETLAEMVKPSIDYVRHKRFRSGNYPSSLSNETDRLVHWCHGASGVIHMLLQAYKVSTASPPAPPWPRSASPVVKCKGDGDTEQTETVGAAVGGGCVCPGPSGGGCCQEDGCVCPGPPGCRSCGS